MGFRFLILFILISNCLNAQVRFYVSPLGADGNPGTETHPFATLNAARDAIRAHKAVMGQPQSYTVVVQDGYYVMKEPFELGPEDSGTQEHPITYTAAEGASPLFSGGKKITGFKVLGNGVWQAKIPEAGYYNWRFDQLYVNGKRATLARTPNKGFLKLDTVTQTTWVKGSPYPAKAQQELFFTAESFEPLKKVTVADMPFIRFKAYHKWDYTLRHISDIDIDSFKVVSSGRGMKPWNELKKGKRVVFENYKAALDAPGEWFLSKEGVLSYIPLKGETLENTTFIAPVLENLVRMVGDVESESFVAHIKINGLRFMHCHYGIPLTGYEPTQAAASINAAIYTEGAHHIAITDCEVANIGQHAIWLGEGTHFSKVRHNYLHDLGGGGVYLGSFKALEGKYHTHHITVDNNIIQHGGQEFPPAVGVWVGHSSDNEITHNDIADFYYTGISVGWVWGYKPSLAKRNTIAYNHLHHIGWDLLSDMAGIYTLGPSEGTTVTNNRVHHIHAYSYGGWGLYADEGTTGVTFKDNLVYNTKTGGFQQNYGKDNVVENNILAFAHKYQMQCTVAEEHKSFTFTNNIVIFKEGMVAKGAWDEVNAHLDKNIYWNVSGNQYDFNGKDYTAWKNLGFDRNSKIADPKFVDTAGFDFRFTSKSAIRKIHFKPFDYAKAGVYGSEEWHAKADIPQAMKEAFDATVEKNLKLNIQR